mmetsp:Transcript_42/g.124  ORF Transcript_42/g.124 Transcript_42/m.124 type:complete len:181 (+) Transcript_42:69-611(+)
MRRAAEEDEGMSGVVVDEKESYAEGAFVDGGSFDYDVSKLKKTGGASREVVRHGLTERDRRYSPNAFLDTTTPAAKEDEDVFRRAAHDRAPAEPTRSSTTHAGDQQHQQPFVNHGLRRWEEGRAKWLRLGERTRHVRRRPPLVDDEVIYDTIFSKPMGWLLPQPVPLPQMVELLEDEWSD